MVAKTSQMPIWVFLAFSSINTRTGAWWLIASSALFTAYCVPWHQLFTSPAWFGKIFLIHDWTWFVAMVPITLWYWISLWWMDKTNGWLDTAK